MEINQEGKHIYYSPNKIEDKHFFGGFFNLAWNNIERVLDLLVDRYYTGTLRKSETILIDYYQSVLKACFQNISPSDWEKQIFFLKQYFPVIYFLDLPLTHDLFKNEIGKKKHLKKIRLVREELINLISLVNTLRNVYTHYVHNPIDENRYCFDLLDRLFINVCKSVRSKRMKTDKTKQLLKYSLKDELEKLIQQKKEALQQKRNKGARVDLSLDAIESSVYNDAFKHLIFKEQPSIEMKNPIEKVNERYKARYSEQTSSSTGVMLSDNSILFLLSMFLSKKENEDMRGKVKGFKRTSHIAMMATHWVFSYLSFKGLKQNLGNTFSKETLLVQVIDELSKVPDEVYRNLSQKSKEQFLEDINEYIKEGKVDYSADESTVIHPVIRKRYQDRFNYYALRYIDEMVDFPTLKLQIKLGSYVHDTRTKNIDGTQYTTERKVKEQFHVFGKLSEVSKLKNDYFVNAQLKEELQNIKWEQYPNPSYNFDNEKSEKHNIPIYIDMNKSTVFGAKEIAKEHKIYQEKNEKEKRGEKAQGDCVKDSRIKIINILFEGLPSNILFCKPTALLSLNELPALLYEVIINKKTGSEIEDIIVRKIVEQQQCLSDYTVGNESLKPFEPKKFSLAEDTKGININKLIRVI